MDRVAVFVDFTTLSLFKDDEFTTIINRRKELLGYQLYIVEQWACSRDWLSSIITTFTGNSEHRVLVSVIRVPVPDDQWNPQLRAYVSSISKHHARREMTSHGALFVTNLSELPSNLTVIPIPHEDLEGNADRFILNENLKRMGCSGRAGLSLASPTGATQAKFRQLYHVSDRIAVKEAAVELVKLCQVALVLFKQLAREFTDGFLCDVTVMAAKAWWAEIGTYYFNVEPGDGPLGPTTVSALLGLLLGARKRLSYCNAPVAKDAFDLKAMKRGIEHFQKWNKLSRSRRLDRHTLHHLHRSTSKFATSEGWAMPKAVKSTVAEIGGKGGEMVIGMVGTRGRRSIAEVESLDIQTFTTAVSGEHCKWLWDGKPRKNNNSHWPEMFTSEDDTASSDDGETFVSKRKKRDTLAGVAQRHVGVGTKDSTDDKVLGSQVSLATEEREQVLRKTVLKNVTDRMTDAKSGFGKFKDAVAMPAFRVQSNKMLKAEELETSSDSQENIEPAKNENYTDADFDYLESRFVAMDQPLEEASLSTEPHQNHRTGGLKKVQSDLNDEVTPVQPRGERQLSGTIEDLPPARSSHDAELSLGWSNTPSLDTSHLTPRLLRSQSMIRSEDQPKGRLSSGVKHSRNLSSSHISALSGSRRDDDEDLQGALDDCPISEAEDTGHVQIARLILQISKMHDDRWKVTQKNLELLKVLDDRINEDIELNGHEHVHATEEHFNTRQLAANLIANEKVPLNDIMTRVEGLVAKLDYELGGLESKVDDVEDAVAEYEDQIALLEKRTHGVDTNGDVEESRWWRLFRILIRR